MRDAVDAVQEGEWGEFATFAGPRLSEITGWYKIALIGDASHPLSGTKALKYYLVLVMLIFYRGVWIRCHICHGGWMDSRSST